MGFSSGEFEVIVDKRFDFTKGLDEKLKDKDAHIITHSGRIMRKDKKPFKTKVNYICSRLENGASVKINDDMKDLKCVKKLNIE